MWKVVVPVVRVSCSDSVWEVVAVWVSCSDSVWEVVEHVEECSSSSGAGAFRLPSPLAVLLA